MAQFERDSHLRSKAEVLRVLARVGVAEESIAQIAAQLPDPVDLHEAAQLLQTYGLTRDALISRLGGSP
jgi:antitoxin component HigA of HigAB toxin-antitoxin module